MASFSVHLWSTAEVKHSGPYTILTTLSSLPLKNIISQNVLSGIDVHRCWVKRGSTINKVWETVG